MELANYLKDVKDWPILGMESFETFLKICEQVSEWAIDDIGLGNRADVYKIWACWIKKQSLQDLKKITERYKSMKLLTHYIDVNIVESNNIALYILLDWKNKWVMSYGITNNKALFKVGEFDFNASIKLPESKILKYVKEDVEDFDSRKHFLLRQIKNDMVLFDPGYCQREDAMISQNEIITSTKGLGKWANGQLMEGEAERLLDVFKNWVKEQKWWSLAFLVVKPRKDGWIDFIVRLK